MDRDSGASEQDQISLYGLFGDSSTTLQGLNDHLTPLLLQQSPPCGSANLSQTAIGKSVTMSPPRGAMNSLQHGVLLSDLADRSPSAGSVTACSYVSYDNLRCMNLVSTRGKRLCSQHKREEALDVTSVAKKAIFEQEVHNPIGFIPVTPSMSGSMLLNTTQLSITKADRTVKLDAKQDLRERNGVDLPDNANREGSMVAISQKVQPAQLRFVRKVGQQITVSTKSPIGTKSADAGAARKSISASIVTQNVLASSVYSSQASKTVFFGPAPTDMPYYKQVEPAGNKLVPQPVRLASKTARTFLPATENTAIQGYAANVKPQTGEDVVKKLLEVLNSRNDLTPQQQISLLQSMGVTVVNAPSTGRKRKSANVVDRKIPVAKSKNLIVQSSPQILPAKPVTVPTGQLQQSFMVNGGIVLKSTPRPSEVLSQQPAAAITDLSFPIETVNKVERKSAPKRKKPVPSSCAKKAKSDSSHPVEQPFVKQRHINEVKQKYVKPTEKIKQLWGIDDSRLIQSSFLTANSSPLLLQVTPHLHASVVKFTQCINEKILSNHEALNLEIIKADGTLTSQIVKTKTLKSRLLKEHVLKRKARSCGEKFNYEQCLKNLRGADVCKLFTGAKNLLSVVRCGKTGKKSMVHHEKILNDLMVDDLSVCDYDLLEKDEDFDAFWNLTAAAVKENLNEKGKAAYTLQTMHLRKEYERLVKEWSREKRDLAMFMECYKDDRVAAMKIVNSVTRDHTIKRCYSNDEPLNMRRCQLSSDSGLSCDAQPLPYAQYCKQHIWHCGSQCLYKLNQSMKPAADIIPEPMVKRARKRPKLLPLIKRYKKKKRKKPEVADARNSVLKPTTATNQVPQGESLSSVALQRAPATITKQFSSTDKIDLGIKVLDSDLDDTKSSDTSEDNLSLTTAHHIMLSGVLDKLPDDPQEFDLFTTDKGAEELERALLLAASSPFPDQDDEDMDLGMEPMLSSSLNQAGDPGDALTGLDTSAASMLSNSKLNHSPDAIVNCDAPKSMEQPPSLDSFNQSQIAHYTFGSNVPLATKKDLAENGYSTEEEAIPPMISAEDLRDLEGVLEKLHAEEANSPKLPSSPAVDHYTSMLARQLSQEVEGETLKEQKSSTSTACSPFRSANAPSLSHSFSLPSPSLHNTTKSFVTDTSVALVKDDNESRAVQDETQNPPARRTRVLGLSAAGLKTHATGTNPAGSFVQNAGTPQSLLLSMESAILHDSTKPAIRSISGTSVPSLHESSSKFALRKSSVTSASVKLPNPISAYSTSQGKVHQTSVMSGQVLPVTLMQNSSQGGNVIKVIVPPGTMVNGSNGQQNMLLIPVNALMKANSVTGSIPSGLVNTSAISQNSASTVNVKTQLPSLQAGQQFFVVNNGPVGPSQAHLALVQKPVGIGTNSLQKGVFLKPSQRSIALQKNETSTVERRELCQDQAKLLTASSVKSSLNLQLKRMKNQLQQHKLPSVTIPVVDGKANGISSSNAVGSPATTAAANAMLNSKLATSATLARFTLPTQGVRKGRGRGTIRKPKAKFDPIAKKYVPPASSLVEASPAPVSTVPISISAGTTQKMAESLMKFNQSTLSIQNKVQQIDSVLSSLNAAKNQSLASGKNFVNGHQEKKSKAVPWTVRSVVYPTHNNSILVPSPVKTTAVKAVPSVTVAVPKVTSQLPLNIASLTTVQGQSRILKSAAGKVTKTATVQLKPSPLTVVAAASSVAKISDLKNVPVPVSSGTVHWNQTTTAGPEITTTTLTVPVYITGAIPAGAWSGEIALNGSLPVLLPARKISPNLHASQRVLLGNIGSLAVPTRVRMATGTTQSSFLKQSLITVPHNLANFYSNKAVSSNVSDSSKVVVKASAPASHPDTSTTFSRQSATHPSTSSRHLITHQVAANSSVPSMQLASQLSATSTTIMATAVARQEIAKVAVDSSPTPRKTGRKASHDTILHDPLMYDPTMLDRDTSEGPAEIS